MQIEIDIPRPFLTLALVTGVGVVIFHLQNDRALRASAVQPAHSSAAYAGEVRAVGGERVQSYAAAIAQGGETIADTSDTGPVAQRLQDAEDRVRQGRIEQDVLTRKADILRGQLRILDAERQALGDKVDPTLELQFENASRILRSLLQDQKRAEDFLKAALEQIWEAQSRAIALGEDATAEERATTVALAWPVAPALGISAKFHDPDYQDRFGFPHDAIDLPALQGTDVHAAADGTVEEVVDHGLGFSYIAIRHAGGVSTLYGHLSSFEVQKGARVRAGDVIGLSGGRPGTPGAGLSTGPHLHFGVFRGGVAIDPLTLLPQVAYGTHL